MIPRIKMILMNLLMMSIVMTWIRKGRVK